MIRPFVETDLEEVEEIEKECFRHPWSKDEFLLEKMDPTGNFFVLQNERIVGYIDFHIIDDFAELYNIAVRIDEQKKGYGQMLLNHMFDICIHKVKRIFLEVRPSNPAQKLYKKNGFIVNRIRKNYYGNEDAIEMVKELR